MAGDKDTLISFGFEPARADWALRATGNAGLQPALDFLLSHADDPIPDAPSGLAAPPTALGSSSAPIDVDMEGGDGAAAKSGGSSGEISGGTSAEAVASSIRCSECSKALKDASAAELHAERTGHTQFEESTEEIKPLTEEEKSQKLKDLRERIAKKREEQNKQNAVDDAENARLRRKADKEAADAREKLKEKQAIQEAEKARREKKEAAEHHKRVLAQIEADKAEKKARLEMEKAIREGRVEEAKQAVVPPPGSLAAPAGATNMYDTARLRIRHGGKSYETTLPSESLLKEVAEFLASQNPDVTPDTVQFSMQYPRKTFTSEDFSKTLKDLRLTPSVVLNAM